MNENVLVQKIEFIKGVGPNKALVVNKELGIKVLQDMLGFFPFRYEDRSEIKKIAEINNDTSSALYEVQVVSKKKVGKYKGKSLKASVKDKPIIDKIFSLFGTFNPSFLKATVVALIINS